MSRLRKPSNKVLKTGSKNEKEEPVETKTEEATPCHPKILWRKVIGRILLSALMIFTIYWTTYKNKANVFAAQKDIIKHRAQEIPCSKAYLKAISRFKGCIPKKCGRLVTDVIVSEVEAAHLILIAKKGMAFGGSSGGASILDLNSGALSQGTNFIDIYKKIKDLEKDQVFSDQDFLLYKNVRHKIQQMIAFNFGIEARKLHLTHPTFFSEITSRAAKTVHDEYWHPHVDQETYPAFHYTSLLYLSDYKNDFTGGRFYFVEKPRNLTVEPKLGRLVAFTSGAENTHYVEKVKSGMRYALIVSFTCDVNYAIEDPSMKKIM